MNSTVIIYNIQHDEPLSSYSYRHQRQPIEFSSQSIAFYDMAKVFNIVRFNLRKTAGIISPKCSQSYVINRRPLTLWSPLSHRAPIASKTSTFNKPVLRKYATSSDGNDSDEEPEKGPALPDLMELPVTTYLSSGSILDLLKIWFISTFRMPSVDKDFKMPEFLDGATQALIVVSQRLGAREYDELVGMVTPEALSILRTNIDRMTPEQISRIPLVKENLFKVYASDMNVETDDAFDPPHHTVKIMVYALLRKQLKALERTNDDEEGNS